MMIRATRHLVQRLAENLRLSTDASSALSTTARTSKNMTRLGQEPTSATIYTKGTILLYKLALRRLWRNMRLKLSEFTELQTWNSNIRVGGKRERSTTASDVDPVMLRALFLNWVVKDNLPFATAESESFRAFFHYANPYANRLLPVSGKTT